DCVAQHGNHPCVLHPRDLAPAGQRRSRRPGRADRRRVSGPPSRGRPVGQPNGLMRPARDLLLVFAAVLAFYCATLAPTVIWSDSAAYAREVLVGPLQFGTAADHPLFIVIGQLLRPLPFELAWLLNLESALFGALAVAMVYRCARQMGTSRIAAAIGAA